MKMPSLLAVTYIFLSFELSQAAAADSRGSAMTKVLSMLTGMLEKGKNDKHEEAVQFTAYEAWCKNTMAEKKRQIKAADTEITKLRADVEKNEADIKEYELKIQTTDGKLSDVEVAKRDLARLRRREKIDSENLVKDIEVSIESIEIGIKNILAANADAQGEAGAQAGGEQPAEEGPAPAPAEAFVQEQMKVLKKQRKGKELSQQEPEGTREANQAKVLELSRKVLDDNRAQLHAEVEAEANRANAYDLKMADNTALEEQLKNDKADFIQFRSKAAADLADSKSNLKDTEDTQAADKKFHNEVQADYKVKSSNFESRQILRTGEIETLQKAITILSGDSVAGSHAEHLASLTQTQGSAMAQLRATNTHIQNQQRAAAYLSERARILGSEELASLVSSVAGDPFKKARGMIRQLIANMMERIGEQEESYRYCRNEMSANQRTRDQKSQAVEMLTAEIEGHTATITKLTEEISQLTAEKAANTEEAATKNDLRNQEKAKNAATLADAIAAQKALAEALEMLNDFYSKAAHATAFIETKSSATRLHAGQPEIFGDEAYTGMTGEHAGPIAILEKIEADFARLESDTRTNEDEAVRQYHDFSIQSKEANLALTTNLGHKNTKKKKETAEMTQKQADLEATQKELEAAEQVYQTLRPECDKTGHELRDERNQRRQEEIESLKACLRIMNGDEIP